MIALGAELIEVDAAPSSSDNHYPKVARRLAEEKAKTEPNGAIWANQFDNVANRQGIWRRRAQKSGAIPKAQSMALSAPLGRAVRSAVSRWR